MAHVTPGEPPRSWAISQGDKDDASVPYLPRDTRLVQAHWFVRHGERAPVRKRMAESGAIPASFNLCSVSRQFSTAVLSSSSQANSHEIGRLEVRRLTESHGKSNEPVRGDSAECYWGELTDLGRRSTLGLGQRLRELYVDKLGFLRDQDFVDGRVTWRSTPMPRTMESLHQIAEGLYPANVAERRIDFVVRSPEDECLYPNNLCARLRWLDEQAAERVAQKYNPVLEEFTKPLGKYVGQEGEPLKVDGKPRANGVLDTIAACKAHGIRVPAELEDEQMLRKLEQVIVHEWFDAYESIDFKRLAMGRLMGDLRHQLEKAMSSSDGQAPKLSVYACHDTSVGGILNALDAFDGRWPPFTSHVAVELLQKGQPRGGGVLSKLGLRTSSDDDYYVRVRYNAENVKIPACAAPGKHLEGFPSVCTWKAFREAVGKVEMTAQEWEQKCQVGPGEKAKLANKIG